MARRRGEWKEWEGSDQVTEAVEKRKEMSRRNEWEEWEGNNQVTERGSRSGRKGRK